MLPNESAALALPWPWSPEAVPRSQPFCQPKRLNSLCPAAGHDKKPYCARTQALAGLWVGFINLVPANCQRGAPPGQPPQTATKALLRPRTSVGEPMS